jgi:hypothetical protein
MKKIIIIAVLFFGATLFFTSCSPYYYQRPYNRYSAPPPRVFVRPVVPRYYFTPPPIYRHRKYIHRHYRRY